MVIWCPETVESEKNLDTSETSASVSEVASIDQVIDENAVSMKKIEENPEPEIEVVPNSHQNIVLFVTVVANFAEFDCNVSEIQIPDTFLMNVKKIFNHKKLIFNFRKTLLILKSQIWEKSI